MKAHGLKRRLRSMRGQAIVEGTMCMLLICLVLFGLLQVFYLSVAQILTDYSAFSAARSGAVGFADYLVTRKMRTATIGASGKMTSPPLSFNNAIEQSGQEYFMVPEYHNGTRWLEYEYWNGGGSYPDVSLRGGSSSSGMMAQGDVTFRDYPLDFPMREAFMSDDSLDMSGEARVMDSSLIYLQ